MSDPESGKPVVSQGDLGTAAVRGAGNMLTGQVLRFVLQIVSVAVLSRLLSPRDYGLLAMVMVVIGFAEVFRDFGLSAAAVQAPVLHRSQRDALFLLNAAIGIGFALVLLLGAPLVTAWFGEQDLAAMSRALAVVFVLNGLTAQYRADLTRSMRFVALTASDIVGQAGGLAVGVVLALLGTGYWALVGQQVAAGLITLLIVGVQCRWLPRWPPRGTQIRSLLNYGGGLSASQFVGYFVSNIDNIIIGTVLGTHGLGLYSRAYQLIMRVVGQVRGPSTSVAVPVLARLADDPDRGGDYIVRGQAALGYTLIAGLGFVAAASTPIVNILLGAGWGEVAPVMAWLAIAAAFDTSAYVGYWVYLARALTSQLFWYNLVSLAIRATCVWVGSQWGIVGVAIGMAIATGVCWPISLGWLARLTPMPLRRLYAGALRILLATTLVGGGTFAAVWSLRGSSDLLALAGALAGAVLGYGLAMLVIPSARREVKALLAAARRAYPRRVRGRVKG